MRYDPDAALAGIRTRQMERAYVIGQIGQTLDGKVATPTGKSLYINGKCALRHLHRLRASVDAVIVGVDTVLEDDPRLTVRLCEGRSPARVVIDPRGRLCGRRRLYDGELPVVVLNGTDCRAGPLPAQVRRLTLDTDADGHMPPGAILAALGALGYRRVLVEGGPTTLSLFLQAGMLDELHVMVAPKIFGSGRDGIVLPPIDTLDAAVETAARLSLFDDGDVLFVCDLRSRAAALNRPSPRREATR